MHDLALAKEILEIVEAYARKFNLTKITEVVVELGLVEGHGEIVSPEHFSDHFELVTKDSLAQEAKLTIKKGSFKGFKVKDIVGY